MKLEKARTVLLDPKMRELYDQWRGVGMCVSFDDWVSLQSRVLAVSYLQGYQNVLINYLCLCANSFDNVSNYHSVILCSVY